MGAPITLQALFDIFLSVCVRQFVDGAGSIIGHEEPLSLQFKGVGPFGVEVILFSWTEDVGKNPP